MKTNSQEGAATTFVSLIICLILLIASLGFGVWAFIGRQDFKNNSDKKAAVAVEKSKTATEATLKKQFDEAEKSPLKTYKSSPTYGSITFSYPKTWNLYVDDSNTSMPLQAYFNPDFVPVIRDTSSYALKVELNSTAYEQIVNQYASQIKSGKISAVAYLPELLKGQANVLTGLRLSGEIKQGKQSVMVVMKVRDKTLKVSTDGIDYLNDFNNTVLNTLAFSP